MAWTDQCCYAFLASARGLMMQQKKRNVKAALRELAKDSGIPFKTLERWWYSNEKSIPKNEDVTKTTNNSTSYDEKTIIHDPHICSLCGKKPCQRKKNKDGTWYYYDKCPKCRTLATPAYEATAEFSIMCPLCGGNFKLKKGDLVYEQDKKN